MKYKISYKIEGEPLYRNVTVKNAKQRDKYISVSLEIGFKNISYCPIYSNGYYGKETVILHSFELP